MLHPNKFFNNVSIQNCNDVSKQDVRKKLMNTHPLNFLESQIKLHIYKVKLVYRTHMENLRTSEKIIVTNICPGGETDTKNSFESLINRSVEKYRRDHTLKYIEVVEVHHVCDVVLQIG